MKNWLKIKKIALVIMALALTYCICCVLALNTLNSANAELQVQNGAVIESYGVGYTFKLNDVDCEVNGVQAVAHVAIKKDGVTLASSAEKQEYTFTEIGEYQLVYYTVLDGKYYNKAVDFSVENKPYFDFSNVNSVYKLGDSIGLEIDAIGQGERYPANVTLSGPDGVIPNNAEYTFSMLGDYTLTAKVEIGGTTYTESVAITVENKSYSNLVYVKDGSAEIEDNYDAPAYRYEGNGLRVKPVSGTVLRYANTVNLNAFDKNTNLISFVAFLGGDFTDITSVSMIFTDVYDESNVIELEIYSLWDSSQTFYRVNFGAISAGINPYDYLPTTKYAARVDNAVLLNRYHETGRYVGKMKNYLSCTYEPSEKAFYAMTTSAVNPTIVLDLDDPKHTGLGKEWAGWTTGEVYADIEVVCESNSQILITELFGQSLSGTEIKDTAAPSLITEIAEEVLPVGQVGKKYKIPQVLAALDVVEGDISLSSIDVQVSKLENGLVKDCSSLIEDGYVTPESVGEYRVEYYVKDSAGNSAVKLAYFTVEDSQTEPQVICELDENVTVGSNLQLPSVTVEGLSTIVESSVKYVYNGKELENVKAGDIVTLNEKGNFKVVYYFKDYIGVEVSGEKEIQLKVANGPVITLANVPYTAIKGRTLILPDFTAIDYNFNKTDAGYLPERKISVNGNELDQTRCYSVTEAVGSKLEVVFSAGTSSQTRYVEVINPVYRSDYFLTDAEKTDTEIGIKLNFNKDTYVKLANPMYANNTLGLNAILSLDKANFETFTLKLTDFNDLSKQISFDVNVKENTVKINGEGEAHAANIAEFLNLTYNNFSKQLINCGLVKTYLNGIPFEGFKDMVIIEMVFGGVTDNSSVTLTTLNRIALAGSFDSEGNLLAFNDSGVEPVLLYKAPTYENGKLTVYSAVAWRLFSGRVSVSVKLNVPGGVSPVVNGVTADKEYVVDASRYGWYNAKYTVEGWPKEKTGKFQLVDRTPIEYSLESEIPTSVTVDKKITLPNVNIIVGNNVTVNYVVVDVDGVTKIYKSKDVVKFTKEGLHRLMIVMTGDVVNKTVYYEIEVKGK